LPDVSAPPKTPYLGRQMAARSLLRTLFEDLCLDY